MGILDKIKEQMRGKAGQTASDTAEKQINKRTGNKYESQVDDAQQKIEGAIGMDRDRDRPQQP
ncbi:Rv0909 family putative TA system antitoxin [Streptomyces geranii]|uniref:Rv0909 family putative TA system antitoxin n=1 Tax=Streptomyces geranii TaxID=2058923 RepID=UPI000D046C15|nr:Rv0909 family putative TA system antitoxin [Streptomyces geranii]